MKAYSTLSSRVKFVGFVHAIILKGHHLNRYFYFNHIITSNIEIPELPLANELGAQTSINLHLLDKRVGDTGNQSWLHHWKAPDDTIVLSYAKTDKKIFLHFPDLACFEVTSQGNQVSCTFSSTTSLTTIRHLLLYQVLPRLFAHFYGYALFHGSCVLMEGYGICFLGNTGWGKSTIAAGFAKAGYTVLTDDCLRIALTDNKAVAVPSYTSVRLLPDSYEALGFTDMTGAKKVADYSRKRRLPLQPKKVAGKSIDAFFFLTAPENCIIVPRPDIIPITKMLAMKELLKNSFSLDLYDHHYLENQFRQLTEIVTADVSFHTLRHPRKYQMIPEVLEAIMRVL